MLVFVDASAFISSLVVNDSNHPRAKKISAELEKEKAQLVTTNMVIAEVLTVLSMRQEKQLALQFGERLRQGGIEVAHPNPDHFEKAWNIFKREKSKNLSFVDCMSFTVIQLFHIPSVFSFDRQFRNRGYTVLS